MEPLTAFFILEGLGFEIVGVILLAQGISDFYFKISYQNNNENVTVEEENGCISITVDSVDTLETNLSNEITNFETIKNSKLLRRYRNRSSQALPFLVGGFILQGIGVITQLLI